MPEEPEPTHEIHLLIDLDRRLYEVMKIERHRVTWPTVPRSVSMERLAMTFVEAYQRFVAGNHTKPKQP